MVGLLFSTMTEARLRVGFTKPVERSLDCLCTADRPLELCALIYCFVFFFVMKLQTRRYTRGYRLLSEGRWEDRGVCVWSC